MDFSGKVSLVTGASQGIGEAIALDLAQAGAEVVLLDIQKDKLEEVTKRIHQGGGKAAAYEVDVSQFDRVAEVIDTVIKNHGKVDHLVNNAGITRDNLLMRMKEEEWDAVIAVNLKGIFNLSKAVIRPMMSNRYGRIVNISSVVGMMGNAGQTNYSASKAGLLGFTKSLAREVASRGVTVNAVAPGYIATAMTQGLPEAVKESFRNVIPLKRFGTAEDVAQAVTFLCSDKAGYITGQIIQVNGGLLM
ncbi:MAG: 3-oxoacyl-[acyl-carrier-protein] reductase [Candidatus Aminicenantes bacterium]|nr:3-oxoacyl-[acyl-carrier-protein] reductase [Candidatus Aminicenantes bacterium]